MLMSVRNRSSDALPLTPAPTALPAAFPFHAVGWDMPDHPIRNLHHHQGLELGFCQAGRGLFLVGGAMAPFRPGTCVIVAPGVPHRARSDAGSTSRWTFCWLDPARLLAGCPVPRRLLRADRLAGARFPAVADPADHPGLSALFAALAAEATGRADREVLRGLCWAVMAACHRLPGRSGGAGDAAALARLGPAITAIQADPAGIPALPELARRCAMSPATLRRTFHRALGCSPRDLGLRLRVQHAAELLRRPGADVHTTALACGFGSANGLARRFRAVLGVSPRSWCMGR